MLILAIDTSTQAGGVAVLRDTSIWGVVSSHAEETYSSRLFRHVDFLLRELNLEMRDFDLYAVAVGPGSFTGLRVGLTAVKGWAEVHHKPIAPVSGLEAIAAQSHAATPLLVPVLDARRGQVYGGLYERGEQGLMLRGSEVVLAPEEFLTFLAREVKDTPYAIVTPTPEILTNGRGNPPVALEVVSSVLAPVVGLLGSLRALRGQVVDALHLDANYVRRSDAELTWKG